VSIRRRPLDTAVVTDPTPVQRVPLRILVVDADDCIRESLAGLLRIGGQCAVVGSAGGPDDALALAVAMRPDVVLLDPRLPAMAGGRTIIACLREAAPWVRILVLTGSDGAVDRARADGADAYVRKTFRPHELIDAVVATAARTSVA
jgi:DNA-binding NarL/FixJ family response regulator